jgi:hypothetical protein
MKRKIVFCLILVLFLFEQLTLSSNFKQAISETTQPNTSPSLRNSSFVATYDNVTTHEGDLIIDGTQTVIIENCTWIQNGNIFVKDFAKLVIQNAAVKMPMQTSWPGQLAWTVEVSNYAQLDIAGSTLEADPSSNTWTQINLHDSALCRNC